MGKPEVSQLPSTVEETCEFLSSEAGRLFNLGLVLFKWIPSAPEVEAKFCLGRTAYHLMTSVEKLRRRLAELCVDYDPVRDSPQYLNGPIARLSRLEGTSARLYVLRDIIQEHVLRPIVERKALLHPTWDEPSAITLDSIELQMRSQLSKIADTVAVLSSVFGSFQVDERSIASAWEECAAGDASNGISINMSMPSLPARDARFSVSESIPKRPSIEPLSPWVVADMHITLTTVEIPTIEACCRCVCEFPEMPFEFVLDMARQVWDEVRHAESCCQRIEELGGQIGQYPCDFKLWNIATNQPLWMRLAVHQRIGEWLGVDAAIANSKWLEEQGDPRTAKLYEFISRDEIGHVTYGNKWLRHLLKTDAQVDAAHKKALELRASFGEAMDGEIPLPIHRWACERSGFSAPEIEYLASSKKRKVI